MVVLDVNVLICAYRREMPDHVICRQLVEDLANGTASFGVPEMVFAGVVRIVTRPPSAPPATAAEALDFCAGVRGSPNCLSLVPTDTHWAAFDRLCRRIDARGKLVADAYLAAFALDRGAEMVTLDRDFARFPGLTWRRPGGPVKTNSP